MAFEQNNNSRFYPRTHDLLSHGLLANYTGPGMRFPPVHQAQIQSEVSQVPSNSHSAIAPR